MKRASRLALLLVFAICAMRSHGQDQTLVHEDLEPGAASDLAAFRARVAASHPDLDVVAVSGNAVAELASRPVVETPRVAIFVKNQSTQRGLDDEMDPLRDVIGAELAGQNLAVMDASDIAAGFQRYKVTTAEERLGLIDGLFTGGSVLRVGQMLGVDYLVLVSLVNADARARALGDQQIVTYQTMLSVRVLEAAAGASVFGQNFREQYPVSTAGTAGADVGYYRDLVYNAAPKIGQALAGSHARWRRPEAGDDALVAFRVRTTIDELINGLENGVRAPNALLDEMRRSVGGVTVELNGAALGSSPGTFRAAPGMHQLRVTRQWMAPWQRTVHIQEGAEFVIALELSDAGLERFTTQEGFRAMTALAYAEAAYRKGIKINFDTEQWNDVSMGTRSTAVNIIE